MSYAEDLNAAWRQHLAVREPEAPVVASVFAGCGGSSLGYSMAGFREAMAVELDDNAVATLRLNFPGLDVYHGDVTSLSVEEILRTIGLAPGELDVLDGSPPCQGYSTAGKRKFDDDRNQLFREYARLVRGLRPKALVMENVSGLVKGKMKLIFAEILRELKACGYRVRAKLMNAMYFGVPQSRERLILIGVREDLGIEPAFPKAITTPITAATAIAGVSNDAAELAMLFDGARRYAAYQSWKEIPAGRNRRQIGYRSGYSARKFHPDRPAFTVTKTCGNLTMHGAMHWSQARRFTVAEFKRFGSFPDPFLFAGTWSDAVSRIGNSVPPLFMRAIARHLRSILFGRPTENDETPAPRLRPRAVLRDRAAGADRGHPLAQSAALSP